MAWVKYHVVVALEFTLVVGHEVKALACQLAPVQVSSTALTSVIAEFADLVIIGVDVRK